MVSRRKAEALKDPYELLTWTWLKLASGGDHRIRPPRRRALRQSEHAFTVDLKGPFDYVTDVDRSSEDLIVDIITRRFPDHNILAEERSGVALPSGPTWIIDPLDGTTNFIHSFPFVAVSIALMVEETGGLGMVYDPLRQELFRARRGHGAYSQRPPHSNSPRAPLSQTL